MRLNVSKDGLQQCGPGRLFQIVLQIIVANVIFNEVLSITFLWYGVFSLQTPTKSLFSMIFRKQNGTCYIKSNKTHCYSFVLQERLYSI